MDKWDYSTLINSHWNGQSSLLLGVIIQNDLTFKTHIHGNNKTGEENITGLYTLSKRVGILKKLSSVLESKQIKSLTHGSLKQIVKNFKFYRTRPLGSEQRQNFMKINRHQNS